MNNWLVVAAMAGIGLCFPGMSDSAPVQGVTKENLLPPRPHNVRNSEGDFIGLKYGRILFIYSHFGAANKGQDMDNGEAYLASRVSSDNGQAWSKKDEIVVRNEAGLNVMSVSLLRLKDGRIALFYLRKNSESDCRPVVRFSSDEGRTWSDAVCCISDEIGYFVLNNCRVIQLKNGRLVMPMALHKGADGKYFDCAVSMCYYSDNLGVTWKRSNVLKLEAKTETGLQEPLVVELKSGRLMLLARTDQGCQMRSWSDDRGATWSPVERSNVISPVAPATIRRIPSTGDLLLVWNDHQNIGEAYKGKRTPLTVAISKDDGKTWGHPKVIENDPSGWYCYTAIGFAGDNVLLGYCATEPPLPWLSQTRITRFDLNWLYR